MIVVSRKAAEMRDRYYRRERLLRLQMQRAQTVGAANHFAHLAVRLVFGPWRDDVPSPRAG